jgi:transcriptional regulator with GAF, ATPase, and Fis domain
MRSKAMKHKENNKSIDQIFKELEELRKRIARVEIDDPGQRLTEKVHENLENQLKERTDELLKANETLKHEISKRKRAEETLEERLRLQELVTRISTRFIDIPADKIDQAIEDQLREIGEFFDADRAVIARLSAKGEVLGATHIWYSEQFDAERFKEYTVRLTYPNFTNYLIHKGVFAFENPDEFSHWPEVKEVCDYLGIKSGLALKLSFDGSILEMFDIVIIRSNCVWTEGIVEQVRILGHIFSGAIRRRRAEVELKKHSEFQNLVSRISNKFVGLSGIEFEQTIQETLAEIGRYFNVDTVRLYRLSLQGDVVKIRNMWRSEHLAPQEEMPEIHKMKYPNLAAHYSQGVSVVFSKFDDSPQWPEMRKILKFFGTKAGVGVPLEIDGSGVDVFAMDKVLSKHVWPEDIVEHSRALGKILLNAMRRREAEVKLQDSYDEIKQLKDQLETDNIYLREEIKLNHNFEEIVGESKDLQYALHRVEKIASTDSTVLILGETGTGKELIARAIHNASPLKNRPILKVNCATLPPNLIESELFGHEKGAFTGAHARQIGRFERADGTTFFLDEIGELPLNLQPKLLRVLQDGEFERLGSSETIKVKVRVITATNRDLEEEIREGRFRQDLYYRLKVFPITVPPLRKRKEDIPLLVNFFVQKICRKLGKEIKEIPKKTIEALQNYPWPGNIRELENVIEGAVITTPGEILRIELPETAVLGDDDGKTLEEVVRDHILKVLKLKNWRIEGPGGAALVLGMNPGTLRSRMQKSGIEKP